MSLSSELSSLLERVANGDLSLEQFEVERTRVLDALWDRPHESPATDPENEITQKMRAPRDATENRPCLLYTSPSPRD